MKLSSPESLRILNLALTREKETELFFADCAKKAGHPGVVSILKGLEEDEKRHADIVAKLISEAQKESPSLALETQEADTAQSRLDRALSTKAMNDPDFSPETATMHETLKKALEIEKESFDRYSEASMNAQEDEVKAIYLYLSKEENKHYVIIDNLIDFIDDPGRWLYEEENLIFRR